MAYIGKNGKDGKDGKDDCGGLAVGLAGGSAAPNIPISRTFFKISVQSVGKIPEDMRAQSNAYWDEVKNYGLIDSYSTDDAGNSELVLSVRDEAEARSLADGDPLIASGRFGNVDVSQL
jgi:hypothetical protein